MITKDIHAVCLYLAYLKSKLNNGFKAPLTSTHEGDVYSILSSDDSVKILIVHGKLAYDKWENLNEQLLVRQSDLRQLIQRNTESSKGFRDNKVPAIADSLDAQIAVYKKELDEVEAKLKELKVVPSLTEEILELPLNAEEFFAELLLPVASPSKQSTKASPDSNITVLNK
jgi:predicted nucleic acid-binding protein